uniref:Saposin B-type domain-containing protein n=1 Tax=Angiostrongylus cantonensis TaxID=6313 RepID=A0A0K0DDM3_ANGCA
MAVHVVSPLLDEGAEKIEQELSKKCKEFKIPFISLACENFIEKHLDPIIEELESGTAEEDVCKKIHEC